MKPGRFGYLRDRLFLVSCFLYALNRWLIKPHVHNAFLRFHFNDLLLIPCALPPLLLMQRLLNLRKHDQMPEAEEIALYFVFWSVLFEAIGPHIFRSATGDVWDVVAYGVGAVIAWVWWHCPRFIAAPSNSHFAWGRRWPVRLGPCRLKGVPAPRMRKNDETPLKLAAGTAALHSK